MGPRDKIVCRAEGYLVEGEEPSEPWLTGVYHRSKGTYLLYMALKWARAPVFLVTVRARAQVQDGPDAWRSTLESDTKELACLLFTVLKGT